MKIIPRNRSETKLNKYVDKRHTWIQQIILRQYTSSNWKNMKHSRLFIDELTDKSQIASCTHSDLYEQHWEITNYQCKLSDYAKIVSISVNRIVTVCTKSAHTHFYVDSMCMLAVVNAALGPPYQLIYSWKDCSQEITLQFSFNYT